MDQELKDYLDGRFGELADRIDGVRTELTERIDGVRTDLTGQIDGVDTRLTGRIDGLRTDLTGQIAEARDENHQTRVLLESLNDKVDLVAEGVQANTELLHRHAEESRKEREEIRTVLGASIRHVERRVSQHDQEIAQLRVDRQQSPRI